MIVFIPIANCQTVSERVLDSIHAQSLCPDMVIIHPTKEFYPKGDSRRYRAIANNKRKIIELSKQLNHETIVISNSDRELPSDCLLRMRNYLNENPDAGAVTYLYGKKSIPGNFSVDTVMIQHNALSALKFNFTSGCGCSEFKKELWAKNFKFGFVLDK